MRQNILRLQHHRAFHATAGDRAFELPFTIDHEMGSGRARGRAPGLDDGGKRHGAPFASPAFGNIERMIGGRRHGCLVGAWPPRERGGPGHDRTAARPLVSFLAWHDMHCGSVS